MDASITGHTNNDVDDRAILLSVDINRRIACLSGTLYRTVGYYG